MVKGRVRLIDIHTHIIPGVDDGSESIRMSLDMLALSAESGITDVIATPHCNIPGEVDNYVSMELYNALLALRKEAERAEIPVTIYRGMEVFATPELPELIRERKVWSLNGTRYLLMEFAFNEDPVFASEMLQTLRKRGVRPVIAHPERYTCLQRDVSLAGTWVSLGCQLQMNKGSVFGAFGRKARRTSLKLLKSGMYTYAASDAHSPYGRTTQLDGLRDYLENKISPDKADILLTRSAEQYLLHRA